MRRSLRWMTLLALVASVITCARPQLSDTAVPRFAITNVTIIDGTGRPPLADQSVIVVGDRIAWLGPAAEANLSDVPRIVDGSGRYLIPGLWDMHVHPDDPEIWEEFDPPAHLRDLFMMNFVAWGVTGVRDMGGNFEVIKDWRRRIAAGELVGPRIVAAGPLLDGPDPMWMGSVPVATAEDGRRAVDSLLAEGVDFIKVYSLLPREAFFAVVERAQERGVRVAGHVPVGVSLEEALASGMDNQEHLLKIPDEFADSLESRRRIRAFEAEATENGNTVTPARRALERAQHATSGDDPRKASSYFRRMADRGIWVTPTLIVFKRNAFYDPADPVVRPLLPYVPAYLRTWWTPEVNVHLRNRSESGVLRSQLYFESRLRATFQAFDEGVRLLAGSDTGGNPHLVPGYSLHEELGLLVEAGLSPMEALRAATIHPAEYLGLADVTGTVAVGKAADLVLLDANPLDDIRNSRAVSGVVLRGRLFDREARAALLQQIRQIAARD